MARQYPETTITYQSNTYQIKSNGTFSAMVRKNGGNPHFTLETISSGCSCYMGPLCSYLHALQAALQAGWKLAR